MGIVEVMVCASLLLVTSISLVHAYSSAGLASRISDRAVAVQRALESVAETLANETFHNLVTYDGREYEFEGWREAKTGERSPDLLVVVNANRVEVGLILVELAVIDNGNGNVLSRLAMYRSGGSI